MISYDVMQNKAKVDRNLLLTGYIDTQLLAHTENGDNFAMVLFTFLVYR